MITQENIHSLILRLIFSPIFCPLAGSRRKPVMVAPATRISADNVDMSIACSHGDFLKKPAVALAVMEARKLHKQSGGSHLPQVTDPVQCSCSAA